MAGAQYFFTNRQGTQMEWFGLFISTFPVVPNRQVTEGKGGIGMLSPPHFLVDGQCPFVEGLSLIAGTCRFIQLSQCCQRSSGVRLFTKCALMQSHCTLGERGCLEVLAFL